VLVVIIFTAPTTYIAMDVLPFIYPWYNAVLYLIGVSMFTLNWSK
jgi:hypothetical protein